MKDLIEKEKTKYKIILTLLVSPCRVRAWEVGIYPDLNFKILEDNEMNPHDSNIFDLKLNLPAPQIIVNQVANLLREGIAGGRFPMGEKLKEEELSSTLGVSRTPLRQALQILSLEGLIELIPRKGAFVSRLDQKDAEELYQILGMFESFAAKQGILGGKYDVTRFTEILSNMEKQIDERNLKGIMESNSDFHHAIVEQAGNKRLMATFNTVWNPTRICQSFGLVSPEDWVESLREHKRIVYAIQQLDVEGTVRLCEEHNLNRCKRVVSHFFERFLEVKETMHDGKEVARLNEEKSY
jgi:DNA-binding GntR family transcriptional regulator